MKTLGDSADIGGGRQVASGACHLTSSRSARYNRIGFTVETGSVSIGPLVSSALLVLIIVIGLQLK